MAADNDECEEEIDPGAEEGQGYHRRLASHIDVDVGR
jgi:hypothetical protein